MAGVLKTELTGLHREVQKCFTEKMVTVAVLLSIGVSICCLLQTRHVVGVKAGASYMVIHIGLSTVI